MSDVPLGAFLSGGLDSSAVVALMNDAGASPIRTFSVGFAEKSYNELPYADAVASHFGTIHTRILLRPDAVSLAQTVGAHLDEPFADVSAMPTFLVSQIAAKSVKVVLTGEGGDEIFGGYDWVVANRMWRQYCRVPGVLRRAVASGLASLPPTSSCKGAVNIVKRFTEADFLPSDGEHLRWMTFFTPDELSNLSLEPGLRSAAARDCYEVPQKFRDAAGTEEFSDADMYVDLMMWLPNDILFKVDLMSMAHSLEARTPLLDHKLVEFCATIPAYDSRSHASGQSHGATRQDGVHNTDQNMVTRRVEAHDAGSLVCRDGQEKGAF
jgi:asparagine synthase (glutamine-hydrolysing)